MDTSIVPGVCRTTWAPGIRQPIPSRDTARAIFAADYVGVEASGAINAAIAACPVGGAVYLSGGTFQCNDYVWLNKGVTLRGNGIGLTILRKTNGAIPNKPTWDGNVCEEYEPVVIVGPNRWPKLDDSTSVNLLADGQQGSKSILMTSTIGFAVGQFVLLDENDYDAAKWTALPPRGGLPNSNVIWASDRIVFQRHNPPEQYVDDPFPDSLSWFSRPGRPLCELKEIAAVNGTTITFTTPLHANYYWGQGAQLTRFMPDSTPVMNAGLEDLSVVGGSDGNIQVSGAAYSWLKDVESTTWVGAAVNMYLAFRVELRDSFIHDGVWPYPGGGGYGISLSGAASEVLIENNIVVGANNGEKGTGINKVLVVRSAGAGSVVGYNYMDNGSIGNNPDWVEVGINGSHMVGSHHLLFEGNESNCYDSDNTHGNAWGMTIFRNHLVGRRRDFPGQSNARCAGLCFGSWWHSFIGNVLGEDGQMGGWTYNSTYPWPDKGIWKLGYDPTHWDQAPDPKTLETLFRAGNFDYLTNIEHWDTLPQTIPPSLYLESKPAFFGDLPWPWVDPSGATKLCWLPARERFEAWDGGVDPEPEPEPEPLFCTDGPDARYAVGEELKVETKQKDRAKVIGDMVPQGWVLEGTEKEKGGKLWLRFRCVGKP